MALSSIPVVHSNTFHLSASAQGTCAGSDAGLKGAHCSPSFPSTPHVHFKPQMLLQLRKELIQWLTGPQWKTEFIRWEARAFPD